MTDEEPQVSVLDLPDPCLLAILQCLATDHASLCSAARAHTRFHQAAVVALRSISTVIQTQQQLDASLLLYLRRHGQQISGVDLRHDLCHDLHRDFEHAAAAFSSGTVSLRDLPSILQLTRIQLDGLQLQLQAGGGSHGVLEAAAVLPLKQLRFSRCMLLDACKGLAAELSMLPEHLEHLCIDCCVDNEGGDLEVWSEGLQRLQQLTYLEFAFMQVQFSRSETVNALQPLKAMTRLVDVRLPSCLCWNGSTTADILSGLCQLTRLEVASCATQDGARCTVQSAAIAGKARLQHLECAIPVDNTVGVGELLSQLRPLQHLTTLVLEPSGPWPPVLPGVEEEHRGPPAEAFSALTESSKLEYLSIRYRALPAGVWHHVFPAGRQLPHLKTLDVSWVRQPVGDLISRLTSCCPGLEGLFMTGLQYNAEQLAQLTRLSSLGRLVLSVNNDLRQDTMDCICQLAGLNALGLEPFAPTDHEGLLLQLTQLRNMTLLQWQPHTNYDSLRIFICKAPGDEPVARQLLQFHLNHSNTDVVQQATAALASLAL